ncbi:MAG: acetyl-CoA carboxylase biotin carboxyl carrier protein subunit [Firmicutes bacterium]|nr:acetyl-CoA carboxylase biotin carboxyl carrier protein subunit [Bacillota bacterium]HXL03450.1 acetyl-CoA carboxylase biotin carboxyl carrier protein subunit [Bacillota bacterium]
MKNGNSFEIRAKLPGELTIHPGKHPMKKTDLPGVGDIVEPRQEVAFIEAMKMQNQILSPKKAKILEIHATTGEMVKSGDLLMTLEEV